MNRLVLMFGLILAVGCAGVQINTNASVDKLPPAGAKLAVVGSWLNNTEIQAASLWLQQHGYVVLERSELDRLLYEQQVALTHVSDHETDLVRVGRLLGLNYLVFVDGLGGYRANVRSVDLSSGRTLWQGFAEYHDNVFGGGSYGSGTELTRAALDAVWKGAK